MKETCPDITGRDILPPRDLHTEPGHSDWGAGISEALRREQTSVLTLARDLVDGDRQADYGEPVDHANRVAAVWSVLFPERKWTAADFALAMVALKLVRETHAHKRDSLVDISGWCEIIDRAHGRR